jgi:acetylornithine deacetylase/succinyl-diaminopimelate desuccinylase-like protein
MNIIPQVVERVFGLSSSDSSLKNEILTCANDVSAFVECITGTQIKIEPLETNKNKTFRNSVKVQNELFHVIINGESNHTGATPMEQRKDATLASDLFGYLFDLTVAREELHKNMNTHMEEMREKGITKGLLPELSSLFLSSIGSHDNVKECQVNRAMRNISIRGGTTLKGESSYKVKKLNFTRKWDIRMIPPLNTQKVMECINERIDFVSKATGVEFECKPLSNYLDDPVLLEGLEDDLAKSTNKAGLPSKTMTIWAGHDIMKIQQLVQNAGMIIIPSTGGSHNPDEKATLEDMVNGINVTKSLVKERAREFDLTRQ